MEIIFLLFVIGCIWLFFVGLPVLGLYFMMKSQLRQELDNQRQQFERQLRSAKARGNPQPPEADTTVKNSRIGSEPQPLKTAYFSETSGETEFHLRPPVATASESPFTSPETISEQTVSATDAVLPPVVVVSTQIHSVTEVTENNTAISENGKPESTEQPTLLTPSFQATYTFPQINSSQDVTIPGSDKGTSLPTADGIATDGHATDGNPSENNIYGIRADDSRRPVPVGAIAAQAARNKSGSCAHDERQPSCDSGTSDRFSSFGPYGFNRETQANSDTGEVSSDELISLELQIGRKILGWIAVGLFVLAGAFFIQLAISRGWLNPLNRFVGMVLAGSAILVYGRHLFRIGWRRYSEMINSAGIITLFSAAYYAKFIGLFSATISGGLLVATILGGFLLSAAYRSMIIGYVATFGGLAIPLLIKLGPDSFGLVFYLSILNLAVLMLINLLGRSHLALIPWIGTPILMIYFWEQNGHTIEYAQSGLLFYTVFFFLYLADTFLAVGRTSRRIGTNDVIRALLTSIIFFGGCRTILLKTENLVLCNLSGKEFFDKFACWVALGLAAISLVAALVSARRSKRCDMIPDRNAVMTGTLSVVVFVFLGIFVPLALKSSAVAVGWLVLAVGLLAMSTKRYNLFFFASVPNDPKKLAQRGSKPTNQLQQFETRYFQLWSLIFFMLGASRLILNDFLPNWVPIHQFRAGCFVFIHPLAAPITCSCVLLVAGMIFVLRRIKSKSDQAGSITDSTDDSNPLNSCLAVVYGVVGLLVFLLLTCSETYSWTVASFERWNGSTPELFGWGAVLYVLTGISLVLFVWGYVRGHTTVRATALGLLAFVAVKATFLDTLFHPLILPQLPLACQTGNLSTFPNHVFLIGDLPIPKYAVPLVNPFVLPLVVCSVVMMFVGVFIRKRTDRAKIDREQFQNESGIGLSLGIWGLALLWVLASLECVAWCEYRPGIYGTNSFYTAHLLIVFWTVVHCVIWPIGVWSRSLAIRVFVYSTLFLQLPFIAWAEFCGKNWRPDTIQWPVINWDALPVLAFAVFLMAVGVWLTRLAREIKQEERITGAWLGSIGIVYTWLLLSFETFRFFTGKEWFGTGDWTRLIALTLLWGFMITNLAVAGVKRKSTLLRLLAMGLLFMLAGKVLLCELVKRGDDFTWPVINSYAAATYSASLFIIIVSCALHSVVAQRLQQTQDHNLCMQLELEQYGWRWLSLAGLAFGWFASSADVYQSARNLPFASSDAQQIIAQMSLSVLWSCFAALLLFLGFRQKSALLRWLAISMFGLTTIKVMTVDLHQVNQIWRVIAFFVLAIALAIAAGAYQRFKPGKENP